MWGFLRVACAIVVLPVTVTLVIPLWIASRWPPAAAPASWPQWLVALAGAAFLTAGGALFVRCVTRFWRDGRGTLAPWDPPRSLVVSGPYAHVRNPMISAVILVLIGEALLLRSLPHLVWAGLFSLLNAIVIPLAEEPLLRARFGERYAEYCRHVPRLVPRLRPHRDHDQTDR